MSIDILQAFRSHFKKKMAEENEKHGSFRTKMLASESVGIIVGLVLVVAIITFTPTQYMRYTIPAIGLIAAAVFKVYKIARENRGKHYAYRFQKVVTDFFGESSKYNEKASIGADWIKYEAFHEFTFPKEGFTMSYTYRERKNDNTVEYIPNGFLISWKHAYDSTGNIYILRDRTERYIGNLGVFFQRLNVTKPKLQRLKHSGFEKIYRVYASDEDALASILTEDVQRLLYEWKAASKLQFHISPTHIKVHYSNERDMLPRELYEIHDNYSKEIDSIPLNYLDARKIKDALVRILGEKASK